MVLADKVLIIRYLFNIKVGLRNTLIIFKSLSLNGFRWGLSELCGQGMGRYLISRVKNLLPGNRSGCFRVLGVVKHIRLLFL